MNNLTRLYEADGLMSSVVNSVAIFTHLKPEDVGGAELSDWLISECEPEETANGASDAITAAPDAKSDDASEGDSREKLEADVREHVAVSISSNREKDGVLASVSAVREWLDRQAAITEREQQAEVDELTAENARLRALVGEAKESSWADMVREHRWAVVDEFGEVVE